MTKFNYATSVDACRTPYRFTSDQVLRLVDEGVIEEDVELFDGVLYKMTKGELHNCVVGLIGYSLRSLIPEGYHVREEKSARLDEVSLPEPDVAVCRGWVTDYYPDLPTLDRLALVVEVEHHSHHADRVEKLAAYAAAGVPVYWVVDAAGRTVEVYTRPSGERYGEMIARDAGDQVEVVIDGASCGRLRVADLFPPAKGNTDK